ncbi:MAG: rhodanese-like domain-containing protein [Alphaproteobacteria bacterium]|nr:rhodanese-like domain-containing protein [Alphaproteobacteria bacterium]
MLRALSGPALLLALVACSGGAADPATQAPAAEAPTEAPAAPAASGARRDVNVEALAQDKDAGSVPVLVDVRTPGEFAEGHVPGAVNIPVDELGGRLSELESHKGDEVYLICRSGSRSSRAADQLVAAGYSAVNVTGGTLAWIDSGRAVEQ